MINYFLFILYPIGGARVKNKGRREPKHKAIKQQQ
jgi:hypothetical protein